MLVRQAYFAKQTLGFVCESRGNSDVLAVGAGLPILKATVIFGFMP